MPSTQPGVGLVKIWVTLARATMPVTRTSIAVPTAGAENGSPSPERRKSPRSEAGAGPAVARDKTTAITKNPSVFMSFSSAPRRPAQKMLPIPRQGKTPAMPAGAGGLQEMNGLGDGGRAALSERLQKNERVGFKGLIRPGLISDSRRSSPPAGRARAGPLPGSGRRRGGRAGGNATGAGRGGG